MWTYDAVGNRSSQTAPSGTTTYDHDANNRLLSAGAVTYTHDPNGNVNGTSAGQIFTYDPFNRMIQAVSSGGTATYTYNGDGLKIQRIGPDGATRYYHDGIRPIWETDGAGAMTAQLDRDIFGNLLSRREASGIRRYYHTDGLGSTVALSDEPGTTAASMLYDAWGNVRASSGSGHGKYRFTGAELDTASDLYHMGARFYDPSIGRWLSEDPAQSFEPVSLNFYAYVANNPLVLIDPTGLMSTGPEGGGCGGDLGCLNEERQREAMGALEAVQHLAANPDDLIVVAAGALLFMGSATPTPDGPHHWHHVLPKYLGGTIAGTRILVDRVLHQAYHGFLDRMGLPRQWGADRYEAMINAGKFREILQSLIDATRQFDKTRGTDLAR